MAQSITYQIGSEPHWADITYGRCEKSPYVDNELWFVHVPGFRTESMTFFVSEQYTHLEVLKKFSHHQEQWKEVAKLYLSGDWNPTFECRWREMPYYVYILPDKTPIRYSLSRSQSKKFSGRELWYVVIGLGYEEKVDWLNGEFKAFVVDKICTEPEFMDKMGSDPERWRLISWEAPYRAEPWYVTIDDRFAPDPFFVFKQDEARTKATPWSRLMARTGK